MIFLSWTVPIFIGIIRFIINETYRKSSQYGVCIPNQESFISLTMNFIAPLIATFLAILIIEVYSSVTAYKRSCQRLREQGPRGNTLSQNTDINSIARMRQALHRITRHCTKPIKGVLVGLGSYCLMGVICPILFVTTQILNTTETYRFYVDSIIIPNTAYCFLILYSTTYSLYFDSIRNPMCLMMKSLIRMICPRCCLSKLTMQRSQRSRVAPLSRHTIQSWL